MFDFNTVRDRTGLADSPSQPLTQLLEFPELSRFPQVKRHFSAVIFDFDGTLGDSLWVWDDIDSLFCEKYGLVMPDDYLEQINLMTFEETAEYFIKELGMKMTVEEICGHFNELAYERYAHEVKLLPGVKEYLGLLKNRGVTMAIASALSWSLLKAVMKNNGIDGYFADFSFCDECCSKQKPDVFLLAAERIGARPEDCLVFEDLIAGVSSARSVGMTACGVLDKRRCPNPDALKAAGDFWIEDFTGLARDAASMG